MTLLHINSMSNYNMKAFSVLVSKSPRQIYRYIKRGQAPDGKKWQPTMIDGAYTFTEADIKRFPDVDDIFRKTTVDDNDMTPAKNEVKDVTTDVIDVIESIEERNDRLLAQFEAIHGKYQLALEAQVSSVKSDYDRLRDKYVMTEVKLKQSEIENESLKTEIVDLKGKIEVLEKRNRSLFQRIFGIK
jgi:hypothetical protein